MSGKHFFKYIQKYHIFFAFAILVLLVYSCNSTKKVPQGKFLLTKNKINFIDKGPYNSAIPDIIAQKPNKKDFFFLFPSRLLIYNGANPKYDSILGEYMTFPSEMRNQNLRDSLFLKYKHPEYVGKSIFWTRVRHYIGKVPVILDEGKTYNSANSIRKFLIYRGYWDAQVDFKHRLDSITKKAEAQYKITYSSPTTIKEYAYHIPYDNIRKIYEENYKESFIKSGDILNETKLEEEVKRITEMMQENGYYSFNKNGGEIFFTADTLKNKKQVPLTLDIRKDSIKTPYRLYKIGNIEVEYLNKITDRTKVDSTYKQVQIKRIDHQYKLKSLWRPITIKKGEIFNQKNLDLTKRNFIALNNFNIASYEAAPTNEENPNDSIINVRYKLVALPKYNIKGALDLHYSQILNFGFSPSAELTVRNIFGGAENLTGTVAGTFGTVYDEKNPNPFLNASEFSLQLGLNFPRLLLPFNTENFVPNRFSPNSSITVGYSNQKNIGMDRANFNAAMNYVINVNDVISHKFSIMNTQFSFIRNKNAYYDYFSTDDAVRKIVFDNYFIYNPSAETLFNQNKNKDEISDLITNDVTYLNSLNTTDRDNFLNFVQVLLKKDRLTRDVLINSFIYNFSYNEIGKKGYKNPFALDAKVELAGNLLSLISKTDNSTTSKIDTKKLFDIPISQFVKFDLDIKKYFTFKNNHRLVVRQFIGVGVPYGNSIDMPFNSSYFNGGSNDIRAWIAFGGLGPADIQVDKKIRAYITDNVKLTTNIEYRFPISKLLEGAAFIDAGNIWSLKDNGLGDDFKFNKFISQMGLGSGFGLRVNIAYITLRFDFAYKLHDPNLPKGERWVINQIKPLQPTFNFSIGYPF